MDISNSLHSDRKLNLLNDIDKLRAQGVSQFVDLPQLIVCGDQSSGKSSVLEAISGIPFPAKDNLCTRFATEVILRNSAETSISVSISPDPEKNAEDCESLKRFHYELSSFEDFPALVESALECMEGAAGRQAFFQDTLQVKVAGPQQPHLTIVDLPGVIHSQNKHQTVEDVKVVQNMVSRYMERRRSIVLAVVSAKYDYPNQIVLKMARDFDPEGMRTLGIITKPDELRPLSDAEKAFVALAQNLDVEFQLGWHVLRNRDSTEKASRAEERDEVERGFFETGAWRGLPRDLVGIDALRPKLSEILFLQIKQQLPSLVKDIQVQIGQCDDTLARLGPPRKTLQEQKRFLISLSQEFQHIVRDASNGTYQHEFFEDPHTTSERTTRLRATVQNSNLDFAETMRKKGQERRIIADSEKAALGAIKRSDYLKEVQKLMRSTRGRELPGMGNPLLVGDLFRQQSKPWPRLIENHTSSIWKAVKLFLEAVITHLCSGATAEGLLSEVIDPMMDERQKRMEDKVKEILRPYRSGHPITYNHYFTETVQKFKSPSDSARGILKALGVDEECKLDKKFVHVDRDGLSAALAPPQTQPDMDLYACAEILECMKAFFKVAQKSVVDNIAIYAIEECLINDLENMLSPTSIWEMSDTLVKRISAEPAQNERQRETTLRKLDVLRKGAATCQAHASDANAIGSETQPRPTPLSLSTTEERDAGSESDEEPGGKLPDMSNEKRSDSIPERLDSANSPVLVSPPSKEEPVEPASAPNLLEIPKPAQGSASGKVAFVTPEDDDVVWTVLDPLLTQGTKKKSKKKKTPPEVQADVL